MKKNLLTAAQRRVIEAVSLDDNLKKFYLSGGTALAAYHLHHRISDDLDFFSFDIADTTYLHDFANRLQHSLNATSMHSQRMYDRNLFFFILQKEELKIEFTKYPFKQLEKPLKKDGILIDSLRDIAANKLMALLDRFDPKDFVDLYFLLKKFTLRRIQRDAEKKFGTKIADLYLGGELMKVMRIVSLPKMLLPLTIAELKDFFRNEAEKLGKKLVL